MIDKELVFNPETMKLKWDQQRIKLNKCILKLFFKINLSSHTYRDKKYDERSVNMNQMYET